MAIAEIPTLYDKRTKTISCIEKKIIVKGYGILLKARANNILTQVMVKLLVLNNMSHRTDRKLGMSNIHLFYKELVNT